MEIQIRIASNTDREQIVSLIYSILREYGFTPDPEGTDADLTDIEVHYLQRGGAFLVLVKEDGTIVGTVGLDPREDRIVELRKMYLTPELRGQGLGKRLLSEAIATARQMGFRRIKLETESRLETAIRLYQSFGFQEIPSHRHCSRCDREFVLDL